MTAIYPLVLASFKIYCRTELGESIYLLGNITELKNWNAKEAVKLQLIKGTSKHFIWQSEKLPLPSNTPIEYKFFKKNIGGEIIWEWDEGVNRIIKLNPASVIEAIQTFGIPRVEIKLTKKMKSIEDDKESSLIDFSMVDICSIVSCCSY